ncbi:hypothetical protein [Methanobrevibacter sp. DSM 116169]|uniref:hypothetical protein n=1 Tax=Methanobrevibacter sp. DSM 116169 TaxID=3242727 RepID=UPI0038FC503B
MKIKLWLILILTLILSISCVSAIDDIGENKILANGEWNFNDLEYAIANTNENDELILPNNVSWIVNFTDGILIDKNITINGNGNWIDAKNSARIFNVSSNSNLILKNITLKNGWHNIGGGAIYNEGNIIISGNVNFFNNSAGQSGGAIGINQGNITIDGTTSPNIFENNSASSRGGVISASPTTATFAILNIIGTNYFINNYATTGGAINGGNLINISGNNSFINNRANQRGFGGAIHGRNLEIYGTNTFLNNSAYSGGALYISGHDLLDIVGSNLFINNTAIYQGGAINILTTNSGNATTYIRGNNTFENNSALNNFEAGGAICYIGKDDRHPYEDFQLIGNTFRNNNAYDGYGGSIFLFGSYNILKIINNNFEDNFAISGGAIATNYAPISIFLDNNIFYNNSASLYGGALYLDSWVGMEANLTNNKFIGNDADYGSGIYNGGGSELYLENNTMQSVKAPIHNIGKIISNTTLTILGNTTHYVKNNTYINLTAEISDDMGNLIIGSHIYLIYGGSVSPNPNPLDNGTYHVSEPLDLPYKVNPVTGYESTYYLLNLSIRNGTLKISDADLEVNKTPGANSVNVNEILNYTITIKNNGTENTSGIYLNDGVPSQLEYIKHTGSGWSYKNENWYYNETLAPGEVVELILFFKVKESAGYNVTNEVIVKSREVPDGVNASSGITNITHVTYSISKIHGTNSTKVGDILNYTIIITNGFEDVNGFVLTDLIPDSLKYSHFIGNNWTYKDDKWYFNGTLSGGESTKIILFFRVLSTGIINNTIIVTSDLTPTGEKTTSANTYAFKAYTISSIEEINGKFGENVTITGTVVDEFGNNITGNVVISLPDGSNVTVDVVNGTFTYEWVIPFNASLTNVSVNFKETDNYEASSASNILNVSKLSTTITIDEINGKYGETVEIKGVVKGEDGNAFFGKVIIILPDGTEVIVNVSGSFRYFWTIPLNTNLGNVSAKFNGTAFYEGSNSSNITNLLKADINIVFDDIKGKAGENVLITGTVSDEFGNHFNGQIAITLPDGTIVDVFVEDGVFAYGWTIPTDFKAGEYLISAEFLANDYYNAANASGILLVVVDPTPGPTPTPTPNPIDVDDDSSDVDLEISLEKTGNPIAILLLALICSLILPLKRRL